MLRNYFRLCRTSAESDYGRRRRRNMLKQEKTFKNSILLGRFQNISKYVFLFSFYMHAIYGTYNTGNMFEHIKLKREIIVLHIFILYNSKGLDHNGK